jgi:hypothetical protein
VAPPHNSRCHRPTGTHRQCRRLTNPHQCFTRVYGLTLFGQEPLHGA